MLTTKEVLKVLDDHLMEEIARCDLLRHAIKGMVGDDQVMHEGCDIMIEQHLSDMIFLTVHAQDTLSEHLEHLKSLEMCKPQQLGDTGGENERDKMD